MEDRHAAEHFLERPHIGQAIPAKRAIGKSLAGNAFHRSGSNWQTFDYMVAGTSCSASECSVESFPRGLLCRSRRHKVGHTNVSSDPITLVREGAVPEKSADSR